MAGPRQLQSYSQDQTFELTGSKESTGVMSCEVLFRVFGTALQGKGFIAGDWRWLGVVNASPPAIQNMLKTYINESGMVTKTLNNQLVGTAGAKLSLKLKNLTENAIARMHGGGNEPVIGLSVSSGKRKKVFAFSGAFTSGGTTTWSFKVTPVNTMVAGSINPISVAWTTDDAGTKAALLAAIKAITGVHQTDTVWSSNTLTVVMQSGYFFTTTTAAAITGGSTTLTSATETDTSEVSTSVDATNGTISLTELPLVTGGAAKITTCITNGTRGGIAGTPQIRILTGSVVSAYEYPRIAYIRDTNIAVLAEPLKNLPADLAVIDVVATKDYPPAGLTIPADLEIQLNFKNHSDASAYIVYYKRASHDTSTQPPNSVDGKGVEGQLDFIAIDSVYEEDSTSQLRPYWVRSVNSAVGNQ